MKQYLNLEKSTTRKGEYVGYDSRGDEWRVVNLGDKVWQATKGGQSFTRASLDEISAALEVA